jgi:DNA-binding response OmpR family regulator
VRLLIVEDEPNVGRTIVDRLRDSGFSVDLASTGAQALSNFENTTYDLMILDVMLPDTDGFRVCQEIRKRGITVPILMLSARHQVEDRVRGLDVGADDYLTKPFAFDELEARIRALLRRPSEVSLQPLTVADLVLDSITRQVKRGDRRIELTPKEFALLEFLMRHAGQAVTRAMIAEQVWGLTWDPLTNVIDVFVNHLRRKIEAVDEARLVHAVRGVGYVIRSPDDHVQ